MARKKGKLRNPLQAAKATATRLRNYAASARSKGEIEWALDFERRAEEYDREYEALLAKRKTDNP